MAWTIKGQASKRLDATSRTLVDLNIEESAISLKLQSLAPDVLTWRASTSDAAGTGSVVPEYGQTVELYSGATRKFFGIVTKPKVGFDFVSAEIQGPWWWLAQIPLTSTQTDATGATAERVTYVFATGDLKTMIENLIDRLIANGAPIIRGTVAAMYDFTKITLSDMSGADALAKLLQRCPDAAAWFDYSGATGTYPILNVSRRNGASAMTAISFTVGTDKIELGEISPRLDLEVKGVGLKFMTREANTGKPKFSEQSSGDAGTAQAGASTTITLRSGASKSDSAYNGLTITINSGTGSGQTKTITAYNGTTKVATVNSAWSVNPNNTSVYTIGGGAAVTGKLQVVTVSGPEIVDFLPLEDFESYALQTAALTDAYVSSNDSFLAGLKKQYGTLAGQADIGLVATFITGYYDAGNVRYAQTTYFPDVTYKKEDGTFASPTGKHLILSAGVPDWVITKYNGIKVTVSGTWVAYWSDSIVGVGTPWSDLFIALRNGAAWTGGPAWVNASTTTNHFEWCARPFSIQGVLINTQFASLTTVYKPWDFDFLNPPAGMAHGLRVAQDWVAWDGSFTTVGDDVTGDNQLNKVVNLAGTLTECATMKAMIKAITYEIGRGRTTYELGAPPRVDFKTAVGRVPSSPQDIIIEI